MGLFADRAKKIEENLEVWGRQLFDAALSTESGKEQLAEWAKSAGNAERRFSIQVDTELIEGASEEETAAAQAAACLLMALPWELVHDCEDWLFQGKHPVRVRRRMPFHSPRPPANNELPIRILLLSPRPEEEGVGYIDHRASAGPLVQAVTDLGDLAELTVLEPPTFPALKKALGEADTKGEPYHVVHFDGHGVYDKRHGLGALCFEDPKDGGKLIKRASESIPADELARALKEYRIPLVFLEACQTAKSEEEVNASVAGQLLDKGVASVVAMSHSVLVETARRFVDAFYRSLAAGERVGAAMLKGQCALAEDTWRAKIMAAGDLHLQDWFVPVLYQEEEDPQLFQILHSDAAKKLMARQRKLSLGDLPSPPKHHFHGRSRELLALERLFHGGAQYVVLRGQGGEGKTELACEAARWLVGSGRFRRAVFVCMEDYSDLRGVLDHLGRQLLPTDSWSIVQFSDLEEALQPVQRALGQERTVIVIDNLETVLPDQEGNVPASAPDVDDLFEQCRLLQESAPETRLIFTTREPLPEPFDARKHEIGLGRVARTDAVELVSQVMANEGLEPEA